MAESVYIDPEDDIHGVLDKLSEYPQKPINLVVPSGARILQNIVDAYLLRDAADSNAQEVTIVTNDVMGKVFAERAGIRVVSASSGENGFVATQAMARLSDIVPQKNRGGSQSKRTVSQPLKVSRSQKAQKTKPAAGAASRFFRLYRENGRPSDGFDDLRARQKDRRGRGIFKPSIPKVIIGVLIFAVVLAGVVFGKVLPRAEVLVYPVREASNFSTEVLVDKSAATADQERGVIPGELLVSNHEATEEFSASGLQNVSSKARGTVTIFNEFSSSPQIFIPSRFQTDDGKIFWTTKTITVPGAIIESGQTTPGKTEAEIIAAEPGEEFNIGPAQFRMPALKGTERYDKIYARSDKPMEGGKIGEAVVVSDQDFKNAFATLRSKLNSSLETFRGNLPKDLMLWDEAYNEETVEEASTKKAGEPADRFRATLKVVARAIVFKKGDFDKFLNEEINSRLSQEQIILPPSKEATFLKPPLVDYQTGTVFATLQVRADVIENLNTDVFKRAILKKNKQEIRQILPTFRGIERVEVKLWPFWVRRVPTNSERVKVSIFGM